MMREEKPTPGSAFSFVAALRRHAGFVVLLVLAVPWIARFAAGPGIATMSDDSVSYLVLARHMLAPSEPLVAEWVGYESYFPPLFPLALAASGAANDLPRAHLVVALFAALALPLLYAHAARVLGDRRAALGAVALFLLSPTAWIGLKGILSETLFLFLTLAALAYHERRIDERTPRGAHAIAFGTLLGLAVLTRTAGVALVAGYATHAAIRVLRGRARPVPLILPLLPVALLAGLWLAWRPKAVGYTYGDILGWVAHAVASDPARLLARGYGSFSGGWVASFAASVSMGGAARAVLLAAGAVAVAGAVLRAARNRLDGWYVLFALPMVFLWVFPGDNMRRLFYPLVPLLIVHAAAFVSFACERAGLGSRRALVLAVAGAGVAAFVLPASLAVQEKSFDRAPVYPPAPYAAADSTDYYAILGLSSARTAAARDLAAIAGFEALARVTPPGAKVMWERPTYVVALGHRRGVAWYYRWNRREVARHLLDESVDYLAMSTTYKADMDGERHEPDISLQWALAFGDPVFALTNPFERNYDFVLLRIDRDRLARYLASGSAAGLQRTRITRKSLTFVRVGPVTTRSPSAEKNP